MTGEQHRIVEELPRWAGMVTLHSSVGRTVRVHADAAETARALLMQELREADEKPRATLRA